MLTSVIPCVPDGPLTAKLSSLFPELKLKLETVEFELTENTFWEEYGVETNAIVLVVAAYCEFPLKTALIR